LKTRSEATALAPSTKPEVDTAGCSANSQEGIKGEDSETHLKWLNAISRLAGGLYAMQKFLHRTHARKSAVAIKRINNAEQLCFSGRLESERRVVEGGNLFGG
jgi:hypothetical protein